MICTWGVELGHRTLIATKASRAFPPCWRPAKEVVGAEVTTLAETLGAKLTAEGDTLEGTGTRAADRTMGMYSPWGGAVEGGLPLGRTPADWEPVLQVVENPVESPWGEGVDRRERPERCHRWRVGSGRGWLRTAARETAPCKTTGAPPASS